MNLLDFEKQMREEHTVEIPGAALLFLCNVLKDRHIALLSAAQIAVEDDYPAKKISDLAESIEANEVVGSMFLGFIKAAFGEEFVEAFISGKVVTDDKGMERVERMKEAAKAARKSGQTIN